MSEVTQQNYVTRIIELENGELAQNDVVRLFSFLRTNGILFGLQGWYHRAFNNLVQSGFLDEFGSIMDLPEDEPEDEPFSLNIGELDFSLVWAHDVNITLRSEVVLVDSKDDMHKADLEWVADFLSTRNNPPYTIYHAVDGNGVHYLKQYRSLL